LLHGLLLPEFALAVSEATLAFVGALA